MRNKKTVVNPEFIKTMHANTTMDDHAVVILNIKLIRTKTSYHEEIQMNSFPEGLYEMFENFGVDL